MVAARCCELETDARLWLAADIDEVSDLAHLTRIVSALRASDAVAEAERI